VAEPTDLEPWLRDACRAYRYDLRGVFRRRGEHPWPLVAGDPEQLEHQLAEGGHLLPLPKEPAALANVLEVSIVDYLLDALAAVEGAAAARGTERGYPDLEVSGSAFGGGFHAVDVKIAQRGRRADGRRGASCPAPAVAVGPLGSQPAVRRHRGVREAQVVARPAPTGRQRLACGPTRPRAPVTPRTPRTPRAVNRSRTVDRPVVSLADGPAGRCRVKQWVRHLPLTGAASRWGHLLAVAEPVVATHKRRDQCPRRAHYLVGTGCLQLARFRVAPGDADARQPDCVSTGNILCAVTDHYGVGGVDAE